MVGNIISCWLGMMIVTFWFLWPMFGFKAFLIITGVASVLLNLLAGDTDTTPTGGGGCWINTSSDDDSYESGHEGPCRNPITGEQNYWDTYETKTYTDRSGNTITTQVGRDGWTVLENGWEVARGDTEDTWYGQNSIDAKQAAEEWTWYGLEEKSDNDNNDSWW